MELLVVEGPDQGRSFALTAQSVIGRDPTATVHLTDEEVSRRHAIVMVGEGRISVEDLGSFNGTHTAAGEVKQETELQIGDQIKVGQTVLELRALEGSEDPENLKPTKTSLPRQA
jgi:pSer/pThr/pTyr-binding forkhead associated (FHA) protein